MVLMVDNKRGEGSGEQLECGRAHMTHQSEFYFLREPKEAGLIQTVWQQGINNCADLFTKNLDGATFWRHVVVFCNGKTVDC